MKYCRYHQLITFVLALLMSTSLYAQKDQISDMDITDRVETEMAWHIDVPANLIDVSTKDGIVLLEGSVNNILAKERAANITGSIRGVRGVVNQIDVHPVMIDDSEIEQNVKTAILEDPAADSYEVNVRVDGGAVTLDGEVQSWQEKELTALVAKGVQGVTGVQNNLEVVTELDRPDNEMQREIERALRADVRLYPNTVDVEVRNGRAILTGSVGSLNDYQLARSYAWTIGIGSVDSEGLKIEKWADNRNMRNKSIPQVTDTEIKEAVKDAFLFDPRVMSFKPEVRVKNGVVTLSGVVDNLKAKRSAEADALNVVGVSMVKNNLKVRPDLIPSNSVLTARVENALGRNPDINRYDIIVTAWYGTVYLDGEVDSYFEKNLAEEIASKVKGVMEIVNELDVYFDEDMDYVYPNDQMSYIYPTPYSSPSLYYTYPLTDLQIETNIEDELWWSPIVNEFAIDVQVTKGVATLSGNVDSWREREAAIENAYEGGAVSVVDNLNITIGSTN